MDHTTDAPSVETPCPWWCEEEHGHPYESESPARGVMLRCHGRDFGTPTGASITATGSALSESGPEMVELDGIAVWIHGEQAAEGLSAQETRDLAEELRERMLEAAAFLERLEQ